MKKSVVNSQQIKKDKKNVELDISELNILNKDEECNEQSISSKNEHSSNSTSMESTTEKGVSRKDNTENFYEQCIGILSIPKIHLTVAVSEGVTMEKLKYSVAHYSNTADIGEKGNCCIAGHRSYTYNEFFNRLDELENGDYIHLETDDEKFIYEVYDVFIVEPTEVGVLDNSENCEITLITCTPVRSATHRLIIKGKLIEK